MLANILRIGNPHLSIRCEEVKDFDQNLRNKLDKMWEILDSTHGVALAANQAGLSERMFVMKGTEGERVEIINPTILMISSEKMSLNEGCLSLPGAKVRTKRSVEIVLGFVNDKGESQGGTFTGMDAVCVQHEMEHLNGENFLQHASRKDRRQIERKFFK